MLILTLNLISAKIAGISNNTKTNDDVHTESATANDHDTDGNRIEAVTDSTEDGIS